MHHSYSFGIQVEGDNGSVAALDLFQLNPFRVAADDTARPHSNWAPRAAEACPGASLLQIRSLVDLCRAQADSASDLATAIAEKMRLTVHLDGAIHGRFRHAHVNYSPETRRWTDLKTGVSVPSLAMLLQAVYARSPRARSPLTLELPRQGEHRTVLQPTEHDLLILRRAATGIGVDLATTFPVWAQAGVTAEQLCLLQLLFVPIGDAVPYESMSASGDPIMVRSDGDFRLERSHRVPNSWLELQSDQLLTEITPDGSSRKVYAHGAHLIPRSLFEEAAHFRNPGELATWLNEPCRALLWHVPRFLLEESADFLPEVKVALRQINVPAVGHARATRSSI
jgi:hypothetical protein